MIEWLLDIAHEYINRSRVYFVCKAMLYFVVIPILLTALLFFQVGSKDIFNIIIQINQLLFDLGFAFLCLALMKLLYDNSIKMPTLGYYAVISAIKGVYQFFITSIGGKGELYTLIFVFSLILHIVVGVQLLKTEFAIFGKAFLYLFGGVLIAAIFSASHEDLLSALAMFLACGILVYTFYKELPLYFD